MEGIRYDSLFLAGMDIKDKSIKLSGNSNDGTNWTFIVSDSIFDSVGSFYLFQSRMDTKNKKGYGTKLLTIDRQDTLTFGRIVLDRKIEEIKAKYLGTNIKQDVPMLAIDEDNFIIGTRYVDSLLLSYHDNTEYSIGTKYPLFGFYLDEIENYQDYIKYLVEIIKQYPDSRYLLSQIAYFLHKFETKE
jgi:hypothetical protein